MFPNILWVLQVLGSCPKGFRFTSYMALVMNPWKEEWKLIFKGYWQTYCRCYSFFFGSQLRSVSRQIYSQSKSTAIYAFYVVRDVRLCPPCMPYLKKKLMRVSNNWLTAWQLELSGQNRIAITAKSRHYIISLHIFLRYWCSPPKQPVCAYVMLVVACVPGFLVSTREGASHPILGQLGKKKKWISERGENQWHGPCMVRLC